MKSNKKFLPVLLIIISIFPSLGLAQNLKILGVPLSCDPALPPGPPNYLGCGIDDFIALIEGLIKLLTRVVVIPLAVLMMIWAGFVIMTAGGSEEKVRKGRAIITTAVVGVVIALLAGAIVGIVYDLIRGGQPPQLP